MQPPAGSQVSRVPAQRTPPDEFAPPPVTPTPPTPRNRAGVVVTLVIGLLAVLAVAGTAAGYLLYDRATAPDRSAPDVVVDNYLRAFLVDRDDTRASFFTCESSADLDAVRALRNEIESREAQFDVSVAVTWGALKASGGDVGRSVVTNLTISSSAEGVSRSSRREEWQFDVFLDSEEWRVCAGRKVS
ncbi:hypothetical protein [Micromonospora sp. SH-82]|uniref:hypothetical protein n=1 Tax=Micromonospora sp. SH-82 TaxID=3132938 RepID=UPI003EB94F56